MYNIFIFNLNFPKESNERHSDEFGVKSDKTGIEKRSNARKRRKNGGKSDTLGGEKYPTGGQSSTARFAFNFSGVA
jgi:hypothetical protein